jgi:hypothetical protein
VPRALEFVLQEAVVEARVVGDEQATRESRQDLFGDILEGRRIGHHRIADAGQALDEGRNRRPGLTRVDHSRTPFLVDFDDADFGDAVGRRRGPGGFEVDEGKGAGRTWCAQGGAAGAASYRACRRLRNPGWDNHGHSDDNCVMNSGFPSATSIPCFARPARRNR